MLAQIVVERGDHPIARSSPINGVLCHVPECPRMRDEQHHPECAEDCLHKQAAAFRPPCSFCDEGELQRRRKHQLAVVLAHCELSAGHPVNGSSAEHPSPRAQTGPSWPTFASASSHRYDRTIGVH